MIAAYLAAWLLAQASQPPVPVRGPQDGRQPQTPASATQQQPAADSRGTDQSPLTVKIQPAAQTDEETAKEKAKEERETSAYRWSVFLGISMAVLGLLQLAVIWIQTTILSRQAEIMSAQRELTDDTLSETRKAADAARDNAKAAIQSAETASRALHASERQFQQSLAFQEGAMARQMKAAKEEADQTLNIARTDQRAWVGVTKPVTQDFGSDTQMCVVVLLINFGRTPAKQVRVQAAITPRPHDTPWHSEQQQTIPVESIVVLQPTERMELPIYSIGKLSARQIGDVIHTKTLLLDVWVRVDYKDVFGNSRLTTYHGWYEPRSGAVVAANDGNDCT